MAKKQDSFYFDNFVSCAEYAVEATKILRACISDYNPDGLDATLKKIHDVEHDADMKKHEVVNVLMKAFITPIERDDIMLLSQCLDEVVDKIEDVVLRLYCDNIRSIRPEMIGVVDIIEECCSEMKLMMEDFRDFRHSKTLKDRIIKINTLEEDADKAFIANMRKLHTTEENPFEIIIWRNVYHYLEQCADAAEHVADVCERILMSNS
ncbi:MAG: DUF47 family protein [Spirochaetes bacterium]|uniref:DUF47 family protein n=1 Tax=Candidatus Ornithospirochaeta stercoravium TaxID=2840897 RepID=A0A9D9NE00_9SPIO|nr:DUF47 family protein [Candidatus Ornithospirochaeta stercoravium]